MTSGSASQLRFVSPVGDASGTFATVLSAVHELGFRYCAFGMKGPLPLVAPRVLWCSNYPAEFQRRYEARGYLQRDPPVLRALVSDAPFLWTDELYAAAPDIRVEACSFGLVHGWAQPRRDAGGTLSLLSCARSEPEITAEELSVKAERLQRLSYRCHERMLEHWGATLLAPIDVELSERERDVLRWASDGKTSADMAQILGVSTATVNFHIRNACSKLGTGSRIAATVRAALMGLL